MVLLKNKVVMLVKGVVFMLVDVVMVVDVIKDLYVLEFFDFKDEYFEFDLE